jgi:hypothetical protein
LVNVTVTDEIAEELPLNVNGTFSKNTLPNCWLQGSAVVFGGGHGLPLVYQPLINELTSTLNVVVPLIVVPGAALKAKVAVFKSRGDEFATTSTVNPDEVTSINCTPSDSIIGTDNGTVSDDDAPVCPVTASVNEMLPATVPGAICGKDKEVAFAGSVTLHTVALLQVMPAGAVLLTNCNAGSM